MNGRYYDFKRLASVREAKMTQDTFAQRLGVHVVTVSRMENGRNASHELLLRACEVLDIDSAKIIYSSRQLATAN